MKNKLVLKVRNSVSDAFRIELLLGAGQISGTRQEERLTLSDALDLSKAHGVSVRGSFSAHSGTYGLKPSDSFPCPGAIGRGVVYEDTHDKATGALGTFSGFDPVLVHVRKILRSRGSVAGLVGGVVRDTTVGCRIEVEDVVGEYLIAIVEVGEVVSWVTPHSNGPFEVVPLTSVGKTNTGTNDPEHVSVG